MSEVTDYLYGYLQELDSYMKRLNSNKLSKKDRRIFMEMGGEYYDIFQPHSESAKETENKGGNDFPDQLLKDIADFNDNIISQEAESKEVANTLYDKITVSANGYMDRARRMELMYETLQRDTEIFRLLDERAQMMEELVDLDVKLYGRIANETISLLEVEDVPFVDNKIAELHQRAEAQVAQERDFREAEVDGQAESAATVQADKGSLGKQEEAGQEKRIIDGEELSQMLTVHTKKSGKEETLDLSGCIISGYVFKGDLSNISFEHAELRNCEFRMTKASHVSMKNAFIKNCSFVQADFLQCDFNNADFDNAKMRGGMLQECAFDGAYLNRAQIENALFWKTSFSDTRIRECGLEGNIFHECGSPEHTVRIEQSSMFREEYDAYEKHVKEMLGNDGCKYSWSISSINHENHEAELAIRVSREGEIVEEERCTALLDPDTYAVLHVDTRNRNDSLVRMFIPEIDNAVRGELQNRPIEKDEQYTRKQPPMFKAIYYESSKPKVIYAGTREAALQKTKDKNPQCGGNTRCYIQEWDKNTDSYKQEGIYLITSGRDITPVELKFPYMSRDGFTNAVNDIKKLGAKFSPQKKQWYVERGIGEEAIGRINECLSKHDEAIYLKLPFTDSEQFKSTLKQIKQDGACYNPDKKQWFITEKEDRNKFRDYLPQDKNSIHNKLNQYKAQEQRQQPYSRMLNGHRKEAPEPGRA